MKEDLLNPKLFGNEAGEDEDPKWLDAYFVDKPEFILFYSPEQKLQIVRARKGMGKSALLRRTQYRISETERNVIAIYCKGSDLVALQKISDMSPHTLVYGWQQRICSKINLELGNKINLAFSDDSIKLVESAELADFKDRNIISALADRLLTKFLKRERIEINDHLEVLKRYKKDNKTTVWLFIDDIDATFLNNDEQRMLISSFFSACRNIINLIRGLNIRVSVRTDVWSVIKQYDESLDKCEQYILDIKWTMRETGDILAKKITAYFDDKYPSLKVRKYNFAKKLNLVFKESFPWGKERVLAHKPLHILSHGRPRWSAQLCKLGGKAAVKRNADRISMQDIKKYLRNYSKSRIDDLYREHRHQCPKIEDLIQCFSRGSRRYSTDKLLHLITDKIIKLCGMPEIDGVPATSLDIAQFLYRIGFIQGKDEQGYYVSYEDKPNLLSSKADLDEGLVWDIHPSYREHLRIT